jgi:uncharacterized membrane-anchored protein
LTPVSKTHVVHTAIVHLVRGIIAVLLIVTARSYGDAHAAGALEFARSAVALGLVAVIAAVVASVALLRRSDALTVAAREISLTALSCA